MSAEKPAGTIPGVREKTVHAGLLHGWIRNDLGLPVFVRDLVVVFDGYAAEGLAIGCQTVAKHAIVRTVRDAQQTKRSQERSQSNSLEPGAGSISGFGVFDRDHPLNYTLQRTGLEIEALTILHNKLGSICASHTSNGYRNR
jgi:hypothetical protein